MIRASCPVCHSKIEISQEPDIGLRIICQNCLAKLEVTWLYPITLDLPEEKGYVVAQAHSQTESL